VIAAPCPSRSAAPRAFYEFWKSGDETFLKRAVAQNFTDRTLPPGRPQGTEGPALPRVSSAQLRATVQKMVVAGNLVALAGHRSLTAPLKRRRPVTNDPSCGIRALRPALKATQNRANDLIPISL
jgi:hypothetical protein